MTGSPSDTPGDEPPDGDGEGRHPDADLPPELEVDPAELARNPNMKVLLAVVVVVFVAALAVGVGWR